MAGHQQPTSDQPPYEMSDAQLIRYISRKARRLAWLSNPTNKASNASNVRVLVRDQTRDAITVLSQRLGLDLHE